MTAAILNMQEAKTQLSKLVERACAGEDVVIARAGCDLCQSISPPNGNVQSDLMRGKFG